MLLNYLKSIVPSSIRASLMYRQQRLFGLNRHNNIVRTHKAHSVNRVQSTDEVASLESKSNDGRLIAEIFPSPRVVPMVLANKEHAILSFDDVPGPKSLKYLANARNYLSEIGTQITVGVLKFGLNINSYIQTKKPLRNLSVLFDEYGPVVRFISPLGKDIVLINHPDHIQKVYMMEGELPVRSTLDSIEKYRAEHRSNAFGGLFTAQGQEWSRQKNTVFIPLQKSVTEHLSGINEVCENFTSKIYNIRNYQDEVSKDLYKELHKWAFDCLGMVLFSKRFTMVETELVYSQCDMSWLYHSLERATDAIMKCESGLQLWKLFPTPAWSSLVKYCDSLDNLIGKHVMEAEQAITYRSSEDGTVSNSLITTMLLGEEKMTPEDISTVIMDMLLIGVNTVNYIVNFIPTVSFGKAPESAKVTPKEIQNVYPNLECADFKNIREDTPYLQACIKETLRLVPPIPVLTRILPKNITLDRYNIPRGTVIIMSPQEASLKESNYESAKIFLPERWLKPDAKDYHSFASIPFGYGSRKCLGQNIAETMMSMLTIRILQKYKLAYYYGDVEPKRTFIAKPNKPLKIRFIDTIQ